ncbi:HD-GYP domain-containing protein [Pleomorphomonas sp. PLEO]|uniref:HD-GYP domain-containing protein n=1 Tax=Pleomorphomonas sp. PLEO TaxID=3239306 RepID=UPI00351E9EE0
MSFPEKRTALLVHSALARSGCDEATIGLVHRYLWDAGVLPLVTELRLHSAFTFSHSLRTMSFAVRIARKMNVEAGEYAILCVGALLHDIGKLWVPISILQKPESLRNSEFETIRTHPEVGYESVADKRVFGWSAVLDIIRHHHECLDGSGYPLGLTAPQISWRARCVSVCDVFCALTEDRPYRVAMHTQDALHILREMARAGKLDGEIVDVFCSQYGS